MRSQLGPSLANGFWYHHKQNWLDKCYLEYRSSYYQQYIYDICSYPISAQLKRS